MNDVFRRCARPACGTSCSARACCDRRRLHAGGFFRTDPFDGVTGRAVHDHLQRRTWPGALHRSRLIRRSALRPQPRAREHPSAEPREPPAIQPRYLSAASALMRGEGWADHHDARRRSGRYIAEERAPGPHCTSERVPLAFAREVGTTVFHPTSTCRHGWRRQPRAAAARQIRCARATSMHAARRWLASRASSGHDGSR